MSGGGYDTIPAVSAKLLDVSAGRRRLLLLPLALLLLASGYFVSRWSLGNTLAPHAPDRATAQLAERLAPSDPQTHFTLAVMYEKSLLPAELALSAGEYERAVSLSPHDYRLWLSLGRARERAGDAGKGEQALRYALELAPAYAHPRWLLGNLLLRQGRTTEAFTELGRAAQAMPTLRPHVFTLAWDVYDGELAGVIAALGDTPATRLQLIDFLLGRQRVDEALALWNQLGTGEKREQAKTGESLMQMLYGLGRFRDAGSVARDLAPEGALTAAPGDIANGGFEQDIRLSVREYFGWQVAAGEHPIISIDTSHRHTGARSLLLGFNGSSGTALRGVSQLVLVEPGAHYRLEFYARTEELRSLSTLMVEVVGAEAGGVQLAASAPLPAGTHGWQQFTCEFVAPQQTEAVTVRLARVPCPDAVCPLLGKIWYDDFTLKRLG